MKAGEVHSCGVKQKKSNLAKEWRPLAFFAANESLLRLYCHIVLDASIGLSFLTPSPQTRKNQDSGVCLHSSPSLSCLWHDLAPCLILFFFFPEKIFMPFSHGRMDIRWNTGFPIKEDLKNTFLTQGCPGTWGCTGSNFILHSVTVGPRLWDWSAFRLTVAQPQWGRVQTYSDTYLITVHLEFIFSQRKPYMEPASFH